MRPTDTQRVMLRPFPLLAISATLVLAVPAAASATTVNVDGKGSARFTTRKMAQVIGVTVNAPGRVRLVAADSASFRPKCVIKRKKACIRRDTKTGDWIVLHAVRFIYDGQGFTMRVTSKNRFRISISGVGTLKLNGSGTYTRDAVQQRYNGNMAPIVLKRR
jgi:ribosomal protein S6E (S10)